MKESQQPSRTLISQENHLADLKGKEVLHMRLVKGDLWAQPADVFVVTTNAILDRYGHLVMGAGAAREAARRFPGLRNLAGRIVAREGSAYGFQMVTEEIGIFQTKRQWRDKADLILISHSARALAAYARSHPQQTLALNYPGIGLGGLSRAEVEPIVATLPDNVIVCYR